MGTQQTKPNGTDERTAVAVAPGTVARQEFGAKQLAVVAETAASSMAAYAQAIVQARYIVAMQRPRDWDDVRMRIMKEVERPGFAEVAWFRKPIGAGVEGLSVRFTDAASRCMGNLLEESPIVYEDAYKRVTRVTVTDLDSNVTKFKDVAIEKTVERSSLNDGRIALSVRTNSNGKPTYTVPATEDEMLAKEGALGSKARRNLILQILPGDIQDAAKVRILEIRRGAVAKDPDGARRKVLDSFATLNILPSDLKAYLGHDVGSCSPAEIQDLRDLYSTIADGTTTWAEVMAEKDAPPADETPKKPGLDTLTERVKAQTQAKATTQTTPATVTPSPQPAVDPADEQTVREFIEKTAEKAAPAEKVVEGQPTTDCAHPNLKRPIPEGKTRVCPDCTLEVSGTPAKGQSRLGNL
jgi:hypothetical protein